MEGKDIQKVKVNDKAKKEFTSYIMRETAYGIVGDLGMRKCTMELIPVRSEYRIEWVVGEDGPDQEIVELGVYVTGNKLEDVDGVMTTPKEAIDLIRENGIDTTEFEELSRGPEREETAKETSPRNYVSTGRIKDHFGYLDIQEGKKKCRCGGTYRLGLDTWKSRVRCDSCDDWFDL